MTIKLIGVPVSPGLSIGKAVLVETPGVEDCGRAIAPSEVDSEVERYDTAVVGASAEISVLHQEMVSKVGQEEAAIFEAQRMMLEDPSLRDSALARIRENLVSAETAAVEACEEQAKILESIDDQYLAARALDLRDIAKRMVRVLSGRRGKGVPSDLPANAIIVASDLTPSDTASLDVSKVAAMVLDKGGRTSHTAILARSLGIPAVVGTGTATSVVRDGDAVAVDGERGEVIVNPNAAELSSLRARAEDFQREKEHLALLKDLPSVTLDGRRVELAANMGNPGDAAIALNSGAEAVGLFRTEFLFIDRETMPGEEEQFEAYRSVLSAFGQRPVVVRTLDIGGDKELSYLDLPKEDNPFLGVRAIRLCLARKDIFRIQLRALLRASVYGNLRIMFPMIANVEELREAKRELEATRAGLVAEGVKVSGDVQVGIMVETPSAAIDADILAPESDFFSIGTNDLVQYTMACDRGNPGVAYLSDPFSPAVLRLIRRTIEEGHKRGIWVGMCGEMAGMPLAIPLLTGMGLDELSMSASAIPRAKEIVRSLDSRLLAGIWDEVRHLGTAEEVKRRLEGGGR